MCIQGQRISLCVLVCACMKATDSSLLIVIIPGDPFTNRYCHCLNWGMSIIVLYDIDF